MKTRIAAALLLITAFSHFAAAQPQTPVPAPSAPLPVASPPARIDDVAWIAGYWEGDGLGGKIEDIWMPPRDGVILGAFRLTKADGKGFYELWEPALRGEALPSELGALANH